jgi:hypoxanthine phosphoribosyltransferase
VGGAIEQRPGLGLPTADLHPLRPIRYGGRMQSDIDRVLISQDRIARRVQELADQITRDHTEPAGAGGPDEAGAEVTIVPVLTGAMIFCADLIRRIPIAMKIGLMTVSSYPGKSLSTQGSQLLHNQLGDVRGRHVLIVDDILDSGGTIRLIVPLIREMGAASVRTCVLLRKDRPAARATHVDYWGFEIPDEFVVGYGLDYNNYYRNLPDIVTLKPHAIARREPQG